KHATKGDVRAAERILELERERDVRVAAVYGQLKPWHKVQVARHPRRPHFDNIAAGVFTDFTELHGDRRFGDDAAMIGGPARLDGRPVMVVGHQKGRDTRENVHRNFGSAHPEGYRKAYRLMKMAEKFGLPVLCFPDTPGASPLMDDEMRGQAEAIATNLLTMVTLRTPIVVTILGEGGSGGALAIGIGDRVLMLEHSIYSVASPEGCAAIIWRDAAFAPQAAEAMKVTAQELKGLGLIDAIVPEPMGGAHRDAEATCANIAASLRGQLADLDRLPLDDLVRARQEKYRNMGVVGDDGRVSVSRPSSPNDGALTALPAR
ncbi:MAG: acetyl-CoA carboxylase carboxyltransferase subunit alpha, partial [Chloroflexota bacterium]